MIKCLHLIDGAKIRISEHNTKQKTIFLFLLSNKWSSECHQTCLNGRVVTFEGPKVNESIFFPRFALKAA